MPENERLGASFSIDVTNLKAGLTQANRLIRESESEFKAAAAGLDDWTKSEEGLNAKIKSLSSIIDVQKVKVDALKKQYKEAGYASDDMSKEAVELRTKINNEEAALRSNEAELKRQEEALKNVGDETEDTSGKYEKLGEIAKTAGKVAAAALAAAAAGIVAITKQAIEGYADYEQLVGGVETLFKDSGNAVLKYAENAYKTAGMSANEYMETVTGFSAALISSLGGDTEKAAKYADMAITDMSDNANKMGSDIESIQNAYSGFSKQNYTMLDNLKLGYGGTKEEMQRLLEDATKLSGVKYDISSYSDIVDAIHVVQTEMGITGTTAKEASSTISGSISSMKSAWSNLVVGLANDNADIDLLITNLIDSIGTVAENLVPRVKVAISGIISMIEKLLPQIPMLIQDLLPDLIEGVISLISGVVTILPEVIGLISDQAPMFVREFVKMTAKIIDSLASSLPELLNALFTDIIPSIIGNLFAYLPDVITAISNMVQAIAEELPEIIQGIIDYLPEIIDTIIMALKLAIPDVLQASIILLMSIIEAIPTIIQALLENLPWIIETIINTVIEAIPQLIEAAIQLFMAIVEAIPTIIDLLIENLPQIIDCIITGIIEALPQLLDAAITLFMAIIQAIPTIIDVLVVQLPSIISTITRTLIDNLPVLIQAAIQLFMGIVKAIPQIIKELAKQMPKIIKSIVKGLKNGLKDVKEVGKNLIKGLWNGISDMVGWIGKKIKGFGETVLGGLKDFFGIESPSRVMADQVGKNLALGIGKGFEDNIGNVNDMITGAMNFGSPNIEGVNGTSVSGGVVVYQTNNYSQAHSRYELYKTKQQTAAAVRLAMGAV